MEITRDSDDGKTSQQTQVIEHAPAILRHGSRDHQHEQKILSIEPTVDVIEDSPYTYTEEDEREEREEQIRTVQYALTLDPNSEVLKHYLHDLETFPIGQPITVPNMSLLLPPPRLPSPVSPHSPVCVDEHDSFLEAQREETKKLLQSRHEQSNGTPFTSDQSLPSDFQNLDYDSVMSSPTISLTEKLKMIMLSSDPLFASVETLPSLTDESQFVHKCTLSSCPPSSSRLQTTTSFESQLSPETPSPSETAPSQSSSVPASSPGTVSPFPAECSQSRSKETSETTADSSTTPPSAETASSVPPSKCPPEDTNPSSTSTSSSSSPSSNTQRFRPHLQDYYPPMQAQPLASPYYSRVRPSSTTPPDKPMDPSATPTRLQPVQSQLPSPATSSSSGVSSSLPMNPSSSPYHPGKPFIPQPHPSTYTQIQQRREEQQRYVDEITKPPFLLTSLSPAKPKSA